MYRDFSCCQLIQSYYLLGVIFFIISMYISLVKLFIFNPEALGSDLAVICLFVPLQLSYIMTIWSLIRVIISDPGKVPVYYGVLMDDSENKKRRYCLICHIFKPDRCHHCSTCKRCVLNMDHHCPWIGNCVGYQNRKFFILFLFYVNLSVIFAFIIMLIRLIPFTLSIDYYHFTDYIRLSVILQFLSFIIVATFGVMIINFFYFHICLVSENRTTIDTLEMKRNNQELSQVNNIFDLGYKKNWLQVLGNNKFLWPLPIFGESGRPVGDGVHWERNQQNVTMTEQNHTNRTNSHINNKRQ